MRLDGTSSCRPAGDGGEQTVGDEHAPQRERCLYASASRSSTWQRPIHPRLRGVVSSSAGAAEERAPAWLPAFGVRSQPDRESPGRASRCRALGQPGRAGQGLCEVEEPEIHGAEAKPRRAG